MCRIIAVLTATCLLLTTINADTNYRLNSLVKPSQYDITITPHFDTNNDLAFTFDGQVYIKVITAETNINKIRLHSEDLVFDASSILITSETSVIGLNPDNPIQVIQQYSFVDINLETTLEPNVIYTIDISYSGPIRDDLNGFYRSYYYEKGVKKWLGATQMEPTHARKVFPCFDEPEYKAVFVLTIDSPENYSPSMANMKLKSSTLQPNGYNRNVFYPTPIMSTYLVAFLVSEFTDHRTTEGTKIIGVYTRPEAYNQSEYAFEMAKKVEQALSTYFNIDYFSKDDYLKLDHIALPDFRAGAMENWGLVKYREGSLLYVPEESSPNYKYGVAQIIAHETTHMWFGDLVTCHWWSDTWLNEGFANYFQDYIVAQIDSTLGSGDILVTGSVYSAYSADETPSAVPISNENVNSPSEISNHFGTISYQKAGSVIRMMHHLLGNTAFANGLNSYLVTNEFSVGYPSLMYAALQQAANSAGSLANYPGATVSGVMGSWVSQAGHPVVVVSVDSDTGNITLRQSRFYTNSSIKTNELYPIPITYTTKSASNFANTKPAFIMTDGVHVFNEPAVKDHGWIMFNIQETGFYRVNYDAHIWSHIGEALNSDDRTNIHYLNRAKVVNDLFAFLTADEVSFGTLYDVLAFLKKETHYSVWYAAISGMNSLRTRYIGTEDLADIDKYILDIMDNIINTLGYVEKSQDDYLTIRNRMQVLEFACKLGHQGCIDAAVTKFQSLKTSGTRISPSLRRVSYCNGLRYGNAADFDFLWSKMLSTNVANEALIIQGTLGCTKVESKLKEYMASITKTDSPIRSQDVNNPLSSILSDHDNAALVLSYLKSNYTLLSNVYPSMSTVVNAVASALHTDAQFNEFDSWLSGCTLCSADVVQSGRTSLTSAKGATVWAKDHRSDIMKLLKNASAKLTPSLLVILSCFLMFYS